MQKDSVDETDAGPVVGKIDWRANAWVAVCTTIANLAAYGFNIVLARPLGTHRFGELAALLAIYLLIQVPGTAMQALVARRIASHSGDTDHNIRGIIADSARIGLALAVFMALLSPAIHSFLHVESWWSLGWIVLIAVPTTVSFALIGILQGQQRFIGVGLVVVNVQLARVAGAVVAKATDPTVASAMAWSFVLITIVTIVATIKVFADNTDGFHRTPELLQTLARDCASVLVVLALSNIDILLAKHYLPSDKAGQYGAGNLITKMAFWAPAFIATVSFPKLSRPHERHGALRRSAFICGILTVVVVGGAAICGPLVPIVLGDDYKPVAGIVWIFALQGAALAALLLGVYAAIAVHDRRLTWVAWLVLVTECLVVAFFEHHTIDQVLGTVCTGSILLMITAVVMERRVLFSRTSTAEPALLPPGVIPE